MYSRKSVSHWEKRDAQLKWYVISTFLIILAFLGLANFGLYQLIDPFTLIIGRVSSNRSINQHLFFNLVLFTPLLLYSFLAILPFAIVNSQEKPNYLYVFCLGNLVTQWVPNLLNFLWYLFNDPNYSVFNLSSPNANLLLSTMQTTLIFVLLIGSMRDITQLKTEHAHRVDNMRLSCLYQIKNALKRETSDSILSLEELMASSLLSLDDTNWILNYFHKKFPGCWNPTIKLFYYKKEVLGQINTLISELENETRE